MNMTENWGEEKRLLLEGRKYLRGNEHYHNMKRVCLYDFLNHTAYEGILGRTEAELINYERSPIIFIYLIYVADNAFRLL